MTGSCLKCRLYTEGIRVTAFFSSQPLALERVFPQKGNSCALEIKGYLYSWGYSQMLNRAFSFNKDGGEITT